ncbi:YqbF domain-containing protein [Bacillus haynesii]|nr:MULTISPECIES: YqbF domain-containing protein [Bacillus]MCY7792059.1 YqbF domain-containing protein [Bacillus haynesii]MCY8346815.1 YqbF domain-containing protein [Bacillus haynesii]MCY8384824.1 YqbF domain-containing protein [Bacillus haynesii]MCY8557974.1 YqbF domain-containing protein [Bacillus haynesii]MCY9262942.1 YqbF domain-containing protein [Bacillus haynesii]
MADTYKAQLIKGKTYDVMDHVFTLGAERDVKKSVYLYLKDNEQFECKLIKEETEGKGDGSKDDGENAKVSTASATPKTYTESELRGMTKTGQEAIISDLGGDPAAFKNADERIAFILQKQGE